MATKKKLLQAAAGSAGGGGGLNVEDVFSTYLYEGNASTQAINNGIDLSGEGGLLWIKKRSGTASNFFFGSDRSADNTALLSNTNLAYYSTSYSVSHSSTGFTVPATTSGDVNESGHDYASWTFRKAPKFFDVVTYTGNGTAGRTVSHNLGSVPGCIIVKCTSNARDWYVYHKGANGGTNPEQYKLNLNSTAAAATETDAWNDTAPTSSVFTVGSVSNVNASGFTYVAYLFAHNDGDGNFGPDGDADIIKCGTYTGGNGTEVTVNLGFEPQFVLAKNADQSSFWVIADNMRGISSFSSGNNTKELRPSALNAESFNEGIRLNPDGFTAFSNQGQWNSNADYIYIAIRRGPMAVPEDAADVFEAAYGNASGEPAFTSNFPVDFGIWHGTISSTNENRTSTRLTQGKTLDTDSTAAEQSSSAWAFDYQDGFMSGGGGSSNFATMWRRAPNFFDVVAYTGNGTQPHNISHNLGVVPEMIWVKRRNSGSSWVVYHKGLNGGTTPEQYNLNLDTTGAEYDQKNGWHDTAPTSTQFTVGSYNNVSGNTFIAYLFASLDGISKVGSFSHTNNTTTSVDCGFSSGARFVMIKLSDGSDSWYIWDTTRGINAGTEPLLRLNSSGAEITTNDWIDPLSSGFQITGPDLLTGTYIFYAIA